MNNVAVNKNFCLRRFVCTTKIKEKNTSNNVEKLIPINTETKKDILNNSISKIESTTFFKEFNSLLASPTKKPEEETQKNIEILITNRLYDKGITASASLAIIYHLINISKKLDYNILESNEINFTKLECYLNLFMNLSNGNIKQIIDYAKKIKRQKVNSNQLRLSLNIYDMEINLANISQSEKERFNIPPFTNFNTQALINANSEEVHLYQNIINIITKLKNTATEFNKIRLDFLYNNIIGAHDKNITQKNNLKSLTDEAEKKIKYCQALIEKTQKKLKDAENISTEKTKKDEENIKSCMRALERAATTKRETEERLKKFEKSLDIGHKNEEIIAHIDHHKYQLELEQNHVEKCKEELKNAQNIVVTKTNDKKSLIFSYKLTLENNKIALKAAKNKDDDTYQRVLEQLKERVDRIIGGKPPKLLAYLQNENKLIEYQHSLPSAFNKLNLAQQEKIVADIEEIINNKIKGIKKKHLEPFKKKFLNKDEEGKIKCGNLRNLISELENTAQLNNFKDKIASLNKLKEIENVGDFIDEYKGLAQAAHDLTIQNNFQYDAKNIFNLRNFLDNDIKKMKDWPINTYQLVNKENIVLQTFTGSLIDKKIESQSHSNRLNAVLKLADKDENSEICFSRLLDSFSEKSKLKKDQLETELALNTIKNPITYRQAHFSEGFLNDWNGTGKDINNNMVTTLNRERILYRDISEKFNENKNVKLNLMNITHQYFLLKKIKNMTATQLTLYNTLHIILKNAIPEFNSIAILGCKSAKDRTAIEIVTENALQAMIEKSLNNEKTEIFKKLDFKALVANNKINIKALTESQIKIFIDNFDDATFYTINYHDNNFFTNQNATTHLRMLSDFNYHNKFHSPYKKITAGS